MDVIALHQAGFNQAVASLGTALTAQQAMLMKRYTDMVLLTYDSDGAGVKAAMRAIPILKDAGLTARVINMEPYKDPDEFIKALGAEEFQKRIDTAESSFFFELRILERQYNFRDPESKTLFFREVAKKLLEFDAGIERNNYIEAAAEKYHLTYDQLVKMVSQTGEQLGNLKKRPEMGKAFPLWPFYIFLLLIPKGQSPFGAGTGRTYRRPHGAAAISFCPSRPHTP